MMISCNSCIWFQNPSHPKMQPPFRIHCGFSEPTNRSVEVRCCLCLLNRLLVGLESQPRRTRNGDNGICRSILGARQRKGITGSHISARSSNSWISWSSSLWQKHVSVTLLVTNYPKSVKQYSYYQRGFCFASPLAVFVSSKYSQFARWGYFAIV